MRRGLPAGQTEISLTPLIDTALTLLIIFMVTTPMIHNAIKVALPKGNAKEADIQHQELVVVIDKESKLHYGDAIYERGALMEALKKQVGYSKEQTVVVKADQAVAYGVVIDLVDQIKHIEGIAYVALATEKRT
jgi:biopolymer transport protein ExbD